MQCKVDLHYYGPGGGLGTSLCAARWDRIFHDWSDYNGVAFLIELLEWGRRFSDVLCQDSSS